MVEELVVDQVKALEGALTTTVTGRDYQTYLTTDGSTVWLEAALAQIGVWLADRTIRIDLDPRTDVERSNQEGNVRVQVLHHRRSGEQGARIRVVNNNSGTLFTTTITLVRGHRGRGWMTVQASCSDRGRLSHTPNVVDRLLDVVDFEDGGPLLRHARHISATDLTDLEHLLNHPQRRLPVLLASPFEGVPFDKWREQVARWVNRSAGITHVAVLDPLAAREFEEAHPTLLPRPGTLRTFPPGIDLTDPTASDTCRWISSRTLAGEERVTARIVDSVVRRWQAERARVLPAEVRTWDSTFDRIANQRLRKDSAPRRSPLGQQILDRRLAAPKEQHPTSTADTAGRGPIADSYEQQPQTVIAAPRRGNRVEWVNERDALKTRIADLERVAAALAKRLDATIRDNWAMSEVLAHVRSTTTIEDLSGAELDDLVELAMREVPDPAEVQRLNDHIDSLTQEREDAEELAALMNEELLEERAESGRVRSDLEYQKRRAAWLAAELDAMQPGRSFEWVDSAAIIPINPLGDAPETWDELVQKLPTLSEHGVHFTGQVRRMKPIESLDPDGAGLRATWKALGTLASYWLACRDGWTGGVDAFCKNAPLGAFHIEPNKHAPDETGLTRSDQRMAKERLLPVPAEISKTGYEYMWAHFKVHTFSKERRIRLHYYDQTTNDDPAIYVGYIGDHLTGGSTTKVRR